MIIEKLFIRIDDKCIDQIKYLCSFFFGNGRKKNICPFPLFLLTKRSRKNF